MTQVLLATLRAAPGLLRALLREVDARPEAPEHWTLGSQVDRRRGRDRLDLHLEGPLGATLTFEVKLRSALTLPQLRRYSRHTGNLVALTERYPEPTKAVLEAEGIRSLRWSDVHRLAGGVSPRSRAERVILDHFMAFLEELGMAYRPVTESSLVAFHGVLKRMNKPLGAWSQDLARVFEAVSGAATGLEEVRRELQPECGPGLSRSGPGLYGIELDDEDFWCLAAGFRTRDYKKEIGFGFEMPRLGTRPPMFTVDLFDRTKGRLVGPRTELELRQVCSRDGTVDWKRVTDISRSAVRKLMPYLKRKSTRKRHN